MPEYIPDSYRPQLEDGQLITLKKISAQNVNRQAVTSLSSAARTATTSGANIPIDSAKGIAVYLNVTAASGTGGLHLALTCVFPDNSTQTLSYQVAAVTTTGRHVMIVYPGGGVLASPTGRVTGTDYQVRIPPIVRPGVVHDDASSYTYSVDYQLLP